MNETHGYDGDITISNWIGDNAVICKCGAEFHFATQSGRINACGDLMAHIKSVDPSLHSQMIGMTE